MMPDDPTTPTPTNDPMPPVTPPAPTGDDQMPQSTTGVEASPVNDLNATPEQRDEAASELSQGIVPEDATTTAPEDMQEVGQDTQAVDSDPDNTTPADVVPGDEKDGND